MHWSLKVPYKCKRSVITGELHKAKRIASNFDNETKKIRSKYTDAGYPKYVIENTIKNVNRKKRWASNTEVVIWWKKTCYNMFAVFLKEWKILCIFY